MRGGELDARAPSGWPPPGRGPASRTWNPRATANLPETRLRPPRSARPGRRRARPRAPGRARRESGQLPAPVTRGPEARTAAVRSTATPARGERRCRPVCRCQSRERIPRALRRRRPPPRAARGGSPRSGRRPARSRRADRAARSSPFRAGRGSPRRAPSARCDARQGRPPRRAEARGQSPHQEHALRRVRARGRCGARRRSDLSPRDRQGSALWSSATRRRWARR